jgi:hypothetical protein
MADCEGGGKILPIAACEEGAGAPEFREMLKRYNQAEAYGARRLRFSDGRPGQSKAGRSPESRRAVLRT